ncbi:protein of unknown function [Paraburkholderia kururiensis]
MDGGAVTVAVGLVVVEIALVGLDGRRLEREGRHARQREGEGRESGRAYRAQVEASWTDAREQAHGLLACCRDVVGWPCGRPMPDAAFSGLYEPRRRGKEKAARVARLCAVRAAMQPRPGRYIRR